LPEGQGDIAFTGTCTGGQSASGSISYKFDNTPPIVNCSVSGGTPGLNGYYRAGPVSIGCTGTDSLSGVASIGYGPQTANSDGPATLRCTVSDVAGNTASAAQGVTIDGTPPAITGTIAGEGGGGWYRGTALLNCAASDAVSGVSGVAYGNRTASENGATPVSCSASDNAGNTANYSTAIQIDNTLPALEIRTEGNICNTFYNSPVNVSLEASDTYSGLEEASFSVNDGPGGLTTDRLGDGDYSIHAVARDVAGNTTEAESRFSVDATPPVSSWNDGIGEWVGGTVTLRGTSVDEIAGIRTVYVSFDDGIAWEAIGAASDWMVDWDTTSVTDGPYTILARADDLACNEEHTAVLDLKVDNTPPDLILEDATVMLGQTTAIQTTDAGSGLDHARVTITGAGMVPRVIEYVPPDDLERLEWDSRDGDGNPVSAGVYTVLVEAWDKVGNYSRTGGRWVGRDTPPNAIISDGSGGWIHADGSAIPEEEQPPPPGSRTMKLPFTGIPFWGIFLPLGGIGSWLVTSMAAFSRDRRWEEWRGLRFALQQYRSQKKVNFEGGDEYD
jgi:hypothetical protein